MLGEHFYIPWESLGRVCFFIFLFVGNLFCQAEDIQPPGMETRLFENRCTLLRIGQMKEVMYTFYGFVQYYTELSGSREKNVRRPPPCMAWVRHHDLNMTVRPLLGTAYTTSGSNKGWDAWPSIICTRPRTYERGFLNLDSLSLWLLSFWY